MSRPKRPSVIDALFITENVAANDSVDAAAVTPPAEPVLPEPVLPEPVAPAIAPSAPPVPRPAPPPSAAASPRATQKGAARKPTPDIMRTSLYIPKEAYRKLKEIALAEDRKPHDCVMQGIDMFLKRYGYPSLAEYKKAKP